MRAENISTCVYVESLKVVALLGLDIYELVNSSSTLEDRLILCPREFHIMFFHIRVIGNYVRQYQFGV